MTQKHAKQKTIILFKQTKKTNPNLFNKVLIVHVKFMHVIAIYYQCNGLSLPEFLFPCDSHFLDQFLRLLQPLLQLWSLHGLRGTKKGCLPTALQQVKNAKGGSNVNLSLGQLVFQLLYFLS